MPTAQRKRHGSVPRFAQWATPRALLRWRHANGCLLYRTRTRSGQEAPQLRPMVIVLDTWPACWGVIEALTWPIAHALALSLARQHRPAVLLTAGDNHVHYLGQPAERLQVLTHRSHQPVDIRAALARRIRPVSVSRSTIGSTVPSPNSARR